MLVSNKNEQTSSPCNNIVEPHKRYAEWHKRVHILNKTLENLGKNRFNLQPKQISSCQGGWESDTTERLHFHFSLSCMGEGNGNPLQCSCLESPRDGGAWGAAVYGVAQSRTRLKRLSSSSRVGDYLGRFWECQERFVSLLVVVVYWCVETPT